MGRTKKTPFPPWTTAKNDGIEQRYIRMGNSLLLHPAYLALSASAKVIYSYMLLEAGGQREFEFPLSKYKRIVSAPTFYKARDELTKGGFVRVKQHNSNLRKPNIYEFSEQWRTFKPP